MNETTQAQGKLRAYVNGEGPGVLVLPSWWGLNPFFMVLCDRLANEGFTAMALNYYGGQVAETIPEAEAVREGMDRRETEKQALETFDWLVERTGGGAAVMGFSLGARSAYGILRARPDNLKGLVAFYGVGGGRYAEAKAPVVAHYAEEDEYGAHPKAAKKMQARLEEAGVAVNSYSYAGTRHWFFEEGCPQYNKEAAELAWERSLDFLKKVLGD
jgi:carboxymethylenebutenolidase